jgi:hypothetical protein
VEGVSIIVAKLFKNILDNLLDAPRGLVSKLKDLCRLENINEPISHNFKAP